MTQVKEKNEQRLMKDIDGMIEEARLMFGMLKNTTPFETDIAAAQGCLFEMIQIQVRLDSHPFDLDIIQEGRDQTTKVFTRLSRIAGPYGI